jgi:hypothetical protein
MDARDFKKSGPVLPIASQVDMLSVTPNGQGWRISVPEAQRQRHDRPRSEQGSSWGRVSMGNEQEPALNSNSSIEEWAKDTYDLSNVCHEKRQLLLSQAISRTKWQKGLHIGSGTVALLSGMASTMVTGTQFVAAALAFLSGIVSLLTTTLFEVKETQRMFEGAYQFLVVRDRLRTLYRQRGILDVGKFMKEQEPLREQYVQISKEYDPMMEQ